MATCIPSANSLHTSLVRAGVGRFPHIPREVVPVLLSLVYGRCCIVGQVDAVIRKKSIGPGHKIEFQGRENRRELKRGSLYMQGFISYPSAALCTPSLGAIFLLPWFFIPDTMAGNEQNVYTGPDALKKYFDPDSAPPLPLVELPEHLNPFYKDGVRIYAKMMTMHPANNVKSMPGTTPSKAKEKRATYHKCALSTDKEPAAMNMLQSSVTPSTKTVIEYSSGSTVISMAMIARVMHGVDDVRAFLSNKTSEAKLRLMQFFGLDITLFGGPSQPEPFDERGGIQSARSMALGSKEILNPNQYENDDNWGSHVRWTGPQIFRQLPEINVLCAGMGTSGTMTGLGTYFKDVKPSVVRLGVCTAAGDRVPGPRSFALMAPVEFPWRAAVDVIEEVNSFDSFSWSLDLCREGIVCGPSSGFNLKGLFQMFEKRREAGTLSELAGPDGLIHSVFLCCDLPYQYISEYFSKLGADKFHPIRNEVCCLITPGSSHTNDDRI